MKAYSTDLRERVVASLESGEYNIPEAARRYKVSEPSIERWVARKRTTGSSAPLPHAGGVPRKLAGAEAVIRAAVKAQPDATLQELCEQVEKETKIKSDPSMTPAPTAGAVCVVSWLGSSCREKKVAPCQSAGHAAGETDAPLVSKRSHGVGCDTLQISG